MMITLNTLIHITILIIQLNYTFITILYTTLYIYIYIFINSRNIYSFMYILRIDVQRSVTMFNEAR